MKVRPAGIIFMVGLIPVAIFSGSLRSSLGDLLSFAVVTVYIIFLRVFAVTIEIKLFGREEGSNDDA
jgi:hypothetical protein